MRAVGRTDPNTRRELRFLCTAASCTLSAPAVVPPHKLIIDHTSPTRPRGPRVQKTTAVGRSAERAMRITSRLHSHSLWTRIVQALESSAIQIISNVHLHVRARPATLDGLWRRRCWLVVAEGGVVAARQAPQLRTSRARHWAEPMPPPSWGSAIAHLRRAGARCALRLNVAVQAVRHPHNPGGSSSTA